MAKADKLGSAVTNRVESVGALKEKRTLQDRIKDAEDQESDAHPGVGHFLAPVIPVFKGYTPYAEGMRIEVGMHLEVPLDKLTDNPNNPRAIYTETDIDEMARSMEIDGQMQAAQVYPPVSPGAPFVFKEGHTRWKGLLRNRKHSMKVEVVEPPVDILDDFRQAREVNKRRKNLTVFDDAIRFKQILEQNPTMKIVDLASYLREGPAYIVKTQKIVDLPQALLERMQDSKELFGIAMSYGVALFYKKNGLEETETLVDQILGGEISSKKLQYLASEQSSAPKDASRRARPLRRTEVQRGGKGELKLFPKGRIEFKLLLSDRKNEQEIFEKLREVLVAHGLTFSDETSSESDD